MNSMVSDEIRKYGREHLLSHMRGSGMSNEEVAARLSEIPFDNLDKVHFVQQFIDSLPEGTEVVIIYGFETEDDRGLGIEFWHIADAVIHGVAVTCKGLKRQMQLDRHDTGHIWKAYFDGRTNRPIATYQDAIIFLGGSVKRNREYDEIGEEL